MILGAELFSARGGVTTLAIAVPAAALASATLSGKALLALIPVFVLVGGLIIYCLVDLIRAPSVRYLPKLVWALIIVLVSAPLGALAYLVFGKDRHGHDVNGHDVNEPAGHVAARW